MNTYQVEINLNLVAVYYNMVKPNMFKARDDDILCDFKNQLDEINVRLNQEDTRRMVNVK